MQRSLAETEGPTMPDIRTYYGSSRPPGHLNAPAGASPSVVSVCAYGLEHLVEKELDSSEIQALRDAYPVVWVNVTGLGSLEVVREIGRIFDLHPLALEDVMHLEQRPKCEDYGSVLFLVARMMEQGVRLQSEQLSMFLGRGFVITFQERDGDCFDGVRDRIRAGRPRIRGQGADYLMYALLDAVIDGYFPVLELYADRLEHLEDRMGVQANAVVATDLQAAKRDLRKMRRIIWPQREAINMLLNEDQPLITEKTRLFFRDSDDHALRIIDLVEAYQDWSGDLTNYLMSTVSNRLNEIMRVLTVIAVIFIPLTFIAGIYGMNFDSSVSVANMPELRWRFGYPIVLSMMGVIGVVQVLLFWRWGWLGSRSEHNTTHDKDLGARV